jgi:hypothetical protein
MLNKKFGMDFFVGKWTKESDGLTFTVTDRAIYLYGHSTRQYSYPQLDVLSFSWMTSRLAANLGTGSVQQN